MIKETKTEKNMKEQFQSFDFFQVCTTITILLNLVKWNQIAFKGVKLWGKKNLIGCLTHFLVLPAEF